MAFPAPQRMRHHSRSIAFAVLLALMLAVSACDTNPPLSPTDENAVLTVQTGSSTVFAQPVANAFCPGVAPFVVPFTVVVQPGGAQNVVVTNIQLQFTDTAGRQAPSVTLPAPVPATQFGSALDQALRFPVSLGIGCGVGRSGTVLVIVQSRDGTGRHSTGRMSIAVR